MAGGSGERIWPLSRRQHPKQLLPIAPGNVSVLEAAFKRLEPLIPAERIWVVTTAELRDPIREQASFVLPENILAEPIGRNTAASMVLTIAALEQRMGPCPFLVNTADHIIWEEEDFRATMARGIALASANDQLIVFGIRPTRPETGYGYIELGEVVDPDDKIPCHHVVQFHEKPDPKTAEEYLATGRHMWNSGMFAWHTRTLTESFRLHAADHHAALCEMAKLDLASPSSEAPLTAIFEKIPNLSIDYAVLETATNVWGLPAGFPWLDVGSWESVRALMETDATGNSTKGDVTVLDTRDSTLYSSGPLVAALGVENLAIVATADAVLVCPRDRLQEIKSIVAKLREEDRGTHL